MSNFRIVVNSAEKKIRVKNASSEAQMDKLHQDHLAAYRRWQDALKEYTRTEKILASIKKSLDLYEAEFKKARAAHIVADPDAYGKER